MSFNRGNNVNEVFFLMITIDLSKILPVTLTF